jgi:hypothetical protein
MIQSVMPKAYVQDRTVSNVDGRMGYFRRHRRSQVRVLDWDAASALPCVEVQAPSEWFVRFGIDDGRPIPASGIFVAAYAAMQASDTEPWAVDAIRQTVDWFNAHLPVRRLGGIRARASSYERRRASAERAGKVCAR